MDRQCLFELEAFKGPSKAVKANLQTLFTNKQRALRIIPKEKPDHLSVIICPET